jgi:hypothetical protein
MFLIEVKQHGDVWVAEVADLADVQATGATREIAIKKTKILALRKLAELIEAGEHVEDVEDLVSDREHVTLAIEEPCFFKLRHITKSGWIARLVPTLLMGLLFGVIAVFDPGPPFGEGFNAVIRALLFGLAWGAVFTFLLFDLGSLKRKIVVTENGITAIAHDLRTAAGAGIMVPEGGPQNGRAIEANTEVVQRGV